MCVCEGLCHSLGHILQCDNVKSGHLLWGRSSQRWPWFHQDGVSLSGGHWARSDRHRLLEWNGPLKCNSKYRAQSSFLKPYSTIGKVFNLPLRLLKEIQKNWCERLSDPSVMSTYMFESVISLVYLILCLRALKPSILENKAFIWELNRSFKVTVILHNDSKSNNLW